MMLKIGWIPVAVVVLLVGCGAAAEDNTVLPANPEPAIPPSQAVERAQSPALLDTLQKMERDYIAEQLLVEADAIAREISKGGTAGDF